MPNSQRQGYFHLAVCRRQILFTLNNTENGLRERERESALQQSFFSTPNIGFNSSCTAT